jgi:8-oxo-dGTP diphosphatase
MPPEATVAAIITDGQGSAVKVLLTRRKSKQFDGQWCLPGGHIDHLEQAETAIVREVKEEIGLDFTPRFFAYFDEIIPLCNTIAGGPGEKPRGLRRVWAWVRRVLRREAKQPAPPVATAPLFTQELSEFEADIHAIVIVFEGSASGIPRLQEDEVREMKWFSLAEACSLPLAFRHNEILDAYAGKTDTVTDETRKEMLAEYDALRSEVLKRIDIRYQLTILTLTATAAFITAGDLVGPLVVMLYPVFALFLTVAWTHSDVRSGQIGDYIRTSVEKRLGGMGWERHLRTVYSKRESRLFRHLTEISSGGIFAITEVLALLFAVLQQPSSMSLAEQWVFVILLLLDFVSLYLTIVLIRTRRKGYRSPRKA